MKKKFVWLVVSCLVALSLVLASCAPAVTEERKGIVVKEEKEKVVKEEKEVVAPTKEKEMVKNTAGKLVEKPRYGGTVTIALADTGRGFDDCFQLHSSTHSLKITNDELLRGDWAKGLSGTGETTFRLSLYDSTVEIGHLAESWEFPDRNTIILHIRQGVHFGLNPDSEASRMVGGRELTAEDVAYSIRRAWSADFPRSWLGRNFTGWLQSVEATDKWTVVVKGDDELVRTAMVWIRLSDYLAIVAPEVVEKYGNMLDWQNSVGTGSFFLTDYVGGSSFTFVRNPNYWFKDPLHPENQWPYLDGFKFLVVPDASTRIAAIRTAKVDIVPSRTYTFSKDDVDGLTGRHPELQVSKTLPNTNQLIFMRTDLEPFNDIRVRRALAMAINNPEIKTEYFAGDAEILHAPTPPAAAFKDAYTPVEELPEATRELFEYHPDKARQLLAEAGYPDGFKTTIPTTAVNADMASLYKAYWADIGVDVEIKVLETAAHTSAKYGRTFEGLIYSGRGLATPYQLSSFLPGHQYNQSVVDDPYINEKFPGIWAWENIGKEDVRAAILKDLTLHILEQAYYMPVTIPYAYNVWWPWIKNFHGELVLGFHNLYDFPQFIWVDQELKKEMGY